MLAARARSRTAPAPCWRQVVVHLLDDDASAAVNAAILGHAGPTDVITQQYAPVPGEPPGLLGEIFLNADQAVRAAPRRVGWTPDRELALYLAHGFDHLSGADDATPEERSRMRRRELAWLRQLPLTPLFQSVTL